MHQGLTGYRLICSCCHGVFYVCRRDWRGQAYCSDICQAAGKTRIQQHQVVYRALGDRMREEIHALSMQTCTPEDWAGR